MPKCAISRKMFFLVVIKLEDIEIIIMEMILQGLYKGNGVVIYRYDEISLR